MLLIFIYCFYIRDIHLIKHIKTVLNNYNIQNYLYIITSNNAENNSTIQKVLFKKSINNLITLN